MDIKKMTVRQLREYIRETANLVNTEILKRSFEPSEKMKNVLTVDKMTTTRTGKKGLGSRKRVLRKSYGGFRKKDLQQIAEHYQSYLNDVRKTKDKDKTARETAKNYGLTKDEFLKAVEIMNESGILDYDNSNRILSQFEQNKNKWKNKTTNELKKIIAKYIEQQAQQQNEISVDDLFNSEF